MYNGGIVSYEISERPVLTQVLSMLDKAFKNRPHSKGCILHSDQGWQYQHRTYQETLKKSRYHPKYVSKRKLFG